jgi:hypothetical protein
MYDSGKIITGLAVFLVLATLPLWYNQAVGQVNGQIGNTPQIKINAEADECVAPADYMRSSHMVILNEWREMVVRDGERVYENADGKRFAMSLSGTCLECHPSRKDFCNQCHDYVGVDPYCWDCHVEPEENR